MIALLINVLLHVHSDHHGMVKDACALQIQSMLKMDNAFNAQSDQIQTLIKALVYAKEVILMIKSTINVLHLVHLDQLGMVKVAHVHQTPSLLKMDSVFNAQLDQIQTQLRPLASVLDQIKNMIQMLEDV